MGVSEKRTAKSEERRLSHVRFVFIAPFPAAGLKSLHHRVARLFEMLIGMLSGGRIAAADVSADQTLAQLHPALPDFQAFPAAVAAGFHARISQFHVLTLCHEEFSFKKCLDEQTRAVDSGKRFTAIDGESPLREAALSIISFREEPRFSDGVSTAFSNSRRIYP